MYRSWNDKQLEDAVKASKSKTEVLTKLGLKSKNSGNYQTIDKYIEALQLDTSHFQENLVGKHIRTELALKDILVENSQYTSTKNLKKKLIKNKLLKEECRSCGIFEWLGKKLILQLDHIDGDRRNNKIDNLRLLCPNCHSLTETFCRGKRVKNKKLCEVCNETVISPKSKKCNKCFSKLRRTMINKQKIDWPNRDELALMVGQQGYLGVAKQLGVSDNAVRKRLNSRKCYNFIFIVSIDVGIDGVESHPMHSHEGLLNVLPDDYKNHLIVNGYDLILQVKGNEAYHFHSGKKVIDNYDFSDICKEDKFILTIKNTCH